MPWSGWQPCAPMSRTRGSRWSGIIMVITAMSAGESGKNKTMMNGYRVFWNQTNHQKSTGRTGPGLTCD
jgi:hypothetical protein